MVASRREKTARKSRLSATQRVELYIRKAIYQGTLRPRERVIEDSIAQRLNCSRGPVREALLRLERDGLIVTVPRRGTFITDISAESIEVVFSMRAKLEGLCVRYLREHLIQQDEAKLRKVLEKMKAAANKSDDEQFLQADMELHRTIWKLSRREQLYRTLNTVMNPFIFMVARAYSSRTPIKERYQNHQEYVDMILTAPVSQVERKVEQYFKRLYDQLFLHNRVPLLVANGPLWFSERPAF